MRKTTSHLTVALLAAAITFALAQSNLLRPPATIPSASAQTAAPAVPAQPELSAEESANVQVYQLVNRGVVHITTRSVHIDDFYLTPAAREGTGSGSVLDRQGHI